MPARLSLRTRVVAPVLAASLLLAVFVVGFALHALSRVIQRGIDSTSTEPGAVAVAVDAARMQRDLAAATDWIAVVLVLGAALVTAGIYLLLRREVLIPGARLRSALERHGRDDLGAAVPMAPGEPLSTLAEGLERMLAALAGSEASARAIVESAPEPILCFDRSGVIHSVNAAAAATFDYRGERLVGAQVTKLLPKLSLTGVRAEGKARVRDGDAEILGVRKDGSTFPVDLSVSEVDLGGQRIFTAIARDASERRQAEEALRLTRERLRHSERLASVGTLAAGVAHEINNPVGTILLAASHGLESLERPNALEVVESCLRDVTNDAERARDIVKSILQFARRSDSKKLPGDLHGVIRRAVEQVRIDAERHRAKLELTLGRGAPRVEMEPTQIEQVLANLLRNAFEAGSEGEVRVTVSSRECGDEVHVVVRDDGAGMSEQTKTHLFDPFYTTRREAGGTGLGLSIAHGIVSEHGGRIEVESQPGRGATFTVVLPLFRAATSPAAQRSASRNADSGS